MIRQKDYPAEFQVKDELYTIRFVRQMPPITGMSSREAEGLVGCCDYAEQVICIATGQTPKERLSTALHEILHAVDHEWEIGLSHQQIYALETALLRLLVDNKLIA